MYFKIWQLNSLLSDFLWSSRREFFGDWLKYQLLIPWSFSFTKIQKFKKKWQAHKRFQEVLILELVQPYLDKRNDSAYDISTVGNRPISHGIRLQGKHFPKSCVKCAYKTKPNGKYKQTKTSNYRKQCECFICKNCFEKYHSYSRL